MGRFDLQPREKTPPQPPRVRPARSRRPRSGGSSFRSGLLGGVLAFIALAAFTFGTLLIGYAAIAYAADLPEWYELKAEASQFQSTRILDREGNLLTETFEIGRAHV